MAESTNASRRQSGALRKSQSGATRKSGTGALDRPGNTGKLISSYYLEIEYLIQRVSDSSTHYQVLGLEQSVGNEAIVRAYHQAVQLLHHRNRKVRSALPDELERQIDKTFEKTSDAFLVLTDAEKRSDYDKSLRRGGARLLPGTSIPRPEPVAASQKEARAKVKEEPVKAAAAPVLPDTDDWAQQAAGRNRRRAERIKLAIPTLVMGHDRTEGKWKEIVKTIDVSRSGAALHMTRRLRHGQVVQLRLPMPARLRCHGHTEPGYKVYAIVRRVELPADGVRVTGFEFLGEQPPPGYLDMPWKLFRSQRWSGPDRRREPRVKRAEPVFVDFLDEVGKVIKRERLVTEDVSPGGMRVILKPDTPDVDMVKVLNAGETFSCMAALRNRFIGDDGRERLCLKLIDQKWPL